MRNNDLMPLIKHCLCDMKFINTGTTVSNENFYMKDLNITEEQKDRLYKIMNDLNCLIKEVENNNKENEVDIMKQSIEFLGFSTRIKHTLFRFGIKTVEELCNKTYTEISSLRCMGKSSMDELVETMKLYNLTLAN